MNRTEHVRENKAAPFAGASSLRQRGGLADQANAHKAESSRNHGSRHPRRGHRRRKGVAGRATGALVLCMAPLALPSPPDGASSCGFFTPFARGTVKLPQERPISVSAGGSCF
jgi:hypothetical protein